MGLGLEFYILLGFRSPKNAVPLQLIEARRSFLVLPMAVPRGDELEPKLWELRIQGFGFRV